MKQNERIEPEILEGEPDSISILQKSGESLAALDSEAKLVAVQWLQQNPDKLNAVLQDPDVQNVLIMAALKNPEIEDGLVRELGFNPMESVPFAEEKEPVELLQTINLPDVDIEKVDGKSETSKEMMTDVEEIQKPSKPEAITLDTVENQKSLNEEIIRSLQRTVSQR